MLLLFMNKRIDGVRFKRNGFDAFISIYDFDEKAMHELKILSFDSYSEAWLDFIGQCRQGKDLSDYDIVMGGIANDKVFNTIELYFDGLIDKREALGRLRVEKPNNQYCFRTEDSLCYLSFKEYQSL